jgi:transposase
VREGIRGGGPYRRAEAGPGWATIQISTHRFTNTTEVTLPEATAWPPADVADTIMGIIELGVTITAAAVDDKTATIFCASVARDPRCRGCGREGRYRETVTRPLTGLPVTGYPLVLQVTVPRYRLCDARVWACGVQSEIWESWRFRVRRPHSGCARYVLRRVDD